MAIKASDQSVFVDKVVQLASQFKRVGDKSKFMQKDLNASNKDSSATMVTKKQTTTTKMQTTVELKKQTVMQKTKLGTMMQKPTSAEKDAVKKKTALLVTPPDKAVAISGALQVLPEKGGGTYMIGGGGLNCRLSKLSPSNQCAVSTVAPKKVTYYVKPKRTVVALPKQQNAIASVFKFKGPILRGGKNGKNKKNKSNKDPEKMKGSKQSYKYEGGKNHVTIRWKRKTVIVLTVVAILIILAVGIPLMVTFSRDSHKEANDTTATVTFL